MLHGQKLALAAKAPFAVVIVMPEEQVQVCLFVIYQASAGVCKAENKSQTYLYWGMDLAGTT